MMGSTGRPEYPNFPSNARNPGPPPPSSSTPRPMSTFQTRPGLAVPATSGGVPTPFQPPSTPPMQGGPPLSAPQRPPVTNTFPSSPTKASQVSQPLSGPMFPRGPPPGPPPSYVASPVFPQPALNTPPPSMKPPTVVHSSSFPSRPTPSAAQSTPLRGSFPSPSPYSSYPTQSIASMPPTAPPSSTIPGSFPSNPAHPSQSIASMPPTAPPSSTIPGSFPSNPTHPPQPIASMPLTGPPSGATPGLFPSIPAYPPQLTGSMPPTGPPPSSFRGSFPSPPAIPPPPSPYPLQSTASVPPPGPPGPPGPFSSGPPPFGSRAPPNFSRPISPSQSSIENSPHLPASLHGHPSFQGIPSGQHYVRPGEQSPLGVAGLQGLVEEFRSLSMSTVPGAIDSAVDPMSLPRPGVDTDTLKPTFGSNCHSRYMRLSCNSIPNSHSLAARWHLPLGAVVHPLAEAPPGEEVPVVNFGSVGIVRCRRCRTYINPYATFADNGRRWRCNICGLLNDVPAEYFCPLDVNGRRRDADERPELSLGSVEFVAPTEYMVRPPMPPVYFFLIDVSASAIRTGMLQVAVDTIKSCLDKLPGFPRTQIGFLTFDSALHFYSLKSSLTQPQMMVVADLEDPFLPMPDDLLVNLSDSRTVVEALLDSLPSLFQNNANVESAFGPALRAVFMIMSQLGGKLLVFQSTMPSLGVGRLKLRGDDPRVYGTDKECNLRCAEDPFYKQMAADFSKYQIGVNIYSFCDRYIDLASLGTLAKYTGGQVYQYPSFQPHLHREKLTYELGRDLTRETAWEAVMRIRCGKGVRFNYFHGHFLLRSSDLMALPAVDCDKAFAMQLTLEETLLTSQTLYFQVALLYTSSVGERRIRIHTFAAPVVSDLGELYRSADSGAIMSLMSRLAIEKTLVSKLDDARQFIQLKLVRCLREYRNIHAVQHPLTGRLIFPESLELLPLYCLALCKTMALRGGYGDVHPDERSVSGYEIMIMSTSRLLNLLYPSLFRVDELLLKELKTGADIKNLQTIPLVAERLNFLGAFLLNDGIRFVLWLGKALPSDFIVHVLGMEAANSADLTKIAVAEQQNELSKRFMSFLKSLRERNPAVFQQCLVVRQGDQPREGFLLLHNLVEDRTTGSLGYADWMVQIHRQVQQKG